MCHGHTIMTRYGCFCYVFVHCYVLVVVQTRVHIALECFDLSRGQATTGGWSLPYPLATGVFCSSSQAAQEHL